MNRPFAYLMILCLLMFFSCEPSGVLYISDPYSDQLLALEGIEPESVKAMAGGRHGGIESGVPTNKEQFQKMIDNFKGAAVFVAPVYGFDTLQFKGVGGHRRFILLSAEKAPDPFMASLWFDKQPAIKSIAILVSEALDRGLIHKVLFIEGLSDDLGRKNIEVFESHLKIAHDGRVASCMSSGPDFFEVVRNFMISTPAGKEGKQGQDSETGKLLILMDSLSGPDVWDQLETFKGKVISDVQFDLELPFSVPAVIRPAWNEAAENYAEWYGKKKEGGEIHIPWKLDVIDADWAALFEKRQL